MRLVGTLAILLIIHMTIIVVSSLIPETPQQSAERLAMCGNNVPVLCGDVGTTFENMADNFKSLEGNIWDILWTKIQGVFGFFAGILQVFFVDYVILSASDPILGSVGKLIRLIGFASLASVVFAMMFRGN